MGDVLALVEARLRTALGEPDARAAVTFLGTDRIEVLRFRTGGHRPRALRHARYVRRSRWPTRRPSLADPLQGPRAELVLSVRAGRADTDKVLRPLAVLAASPQVEGVVVAPGASLDVGNRCGPGRPFTSVLVAEPGGLVEDLELDEPLDPVRFLPLLPMTHERGRLEAGARRARRSRSAGWSTGRTCAIRCAGPYRWTDTRAGSVRSRSTEQSRRAAWAPAGSAAPGPCASSWRARRRSAPHAQRRTPDRRRAHRPRAVTAATTNGMWMSVHSSIFGARNGAAAAANQRTKL